MASGNLFQHIVSQWRPDQPELAVQSQEEWAASAAVPRASVEGDAPSAPLLPAAASEVRPWTSMDEQRLQQWADHMLWYQIMHAKVASTYRAWDLALVVIGGIINSILSMAGMGVSGLEEGVLSNFIVVFAVLVIVTTVLGVVNKTMGFARREQAHRAGANSCHALFDKIQAQLAYAPEDRAPVMAFSKAVEDEYVAVKHVLPALPTSVIRRIVKDHVSLMADTSLPDEFRLFARQIQESFVRQQRRYTAANPAGHPTMGAASASGRLPVAATDGAIGGSGSTPLRWGVL